MTRRSWLWAALFGWLLVAPCVVPSTAAAPPGPTGVVLVAPITGMIDLGLGPFVERALSEARAVGARGVLLPIDTLGGRVDAAVAIRDHLLESPVTTVAFVDKRAISAGALIALAAEKVAMAPGSTMGAATPIQIDLTGEAGPVEEKTVSYVRKEFRATADARGRPGLIAEAMVDADVEIPGLVEKGKLLTLTTEEARQHGVADLEARDVADLLAQLGWADAELRTLRENWAERVVRFLTQPVVASLLITLGVLGLVVELRTPGFGIPGLVGMLSLAAFFWGHWLVRLVGWEQLLLVTAGVIALLVELFVLPGFGIAGVAGLVLLVAGLSTTLIGDGASLNATIGALSYVAIAIVLAALASLLLLRFLPRLPMSRQLVLATALEEEAASASAEPALGPLGVGACGSALTPLRPAGIASFGGRRVDVVSDGDYIAAGEPVVVVAESASRIVVKHGTAAQPERSST